MVVTEDLGKQAEMAICLLYNTPYNGKYKYGLEKPIILCEKFRPILSYFPNCTHTADKGGQYDFTGDRHLSVKTSKADGKVCPQVTGQPTKASFCRYFGLEEISSNERIKEYIIANLQHVLSEHFKNTFDADILYYNEKMNQVLFIKTKNPIDWTNVVLTLSHILKNKVWGESTTLYVKNKTIGEFQVHTHRNCIKFRWNLINLVEMLPGHFDIINLSM